jgi:tRNA A-37 threonylcarbamoyl transferase component Bud32
MDVSAVAPFANVACPTCGKHTRVKCEFGPYTLVRRHAMGGMSMVFVARDSTLDREVALKILSEDYSADEKRISAFEEEARITASFSHPHVVRVLTTGKAFGRFYIAMELVPGGHFEHQIRERGKIPELEMLPFAIEVAQGLKAAHSAGLIHRDVKPGNILLDAEGHAKIVDFGLALVTQGGSAQATEIWATPYYVPPETIEGSPEDFRADIYAFGATLYHALVGRPSCGEQTMATETLREAKKKVIPIGFADASISVDTCRIVDHAMAYDPKERFESYDELIKQLEVALKRLESGTAILAESAQRTARRRAKQKQAELINWSLAGLILLGAVTGGIWWITRDAPPAQQAPVLVGNSLVIPESISAAATDIAKSYREARAAVEAREFAKAAEGFVKLRENPSVQEPTRTWAGVEAVIARYLDGDSSEAKRQAKETAAHAATVDTSAPRVGGVLTNALERISHLPSIPAKQLDSSSSDASHVAAWMLAGLKNWEQGMFEEARPYFSAVVSAKISTDEQWLTIYQQFAKNYLTDFKSLSNTVFTKLPADPASCEAAVAELNQILGTLKTKGRARFNVRAWQLDLTRHSKLLESPEVPAAKTSTTAIPEWDSETVMLKLGDFSNSCRFSEASEYLKSFPAEPMQVSLRSLTDAAAEFLKDLKTDLGKQKITGEYLMKSGAVVRGISMDAAGSIITLDDSGQGQVATWEDFSPDTLIALHRIYMKNPMSETDRLLRHERAISYGWLTGNREAALTAANSLSQSSPEFKSRWTSIESGLPD